MINISYIKSPHKYETELEMLLLKYDSEFIPSLSSRNSTTEKFDSNTNSSSIKPYLNDLLNQELIIATINNNIIGFLSFYENKDDINLHNYIPCIYVSTTIVEREYRNKGVAKMMNKYLTEKIVPNRNVDYITRRTWSTNTASISYIKSMNFKLIKKITDDRCKNIHTLYFAKECKNP